MSLVGGEGGRSATTAQSDPVTQSTSHSELVRPPRLHRRAQVAVVGFGLHLVASLLIPTFTDTDLMPGFALMSAGLMVLLGFAELLDARQRRFIGVVRCGGAATLLLGFAVQLL